MLIHVLLKLIYIYMPFSLRSILVIKMKSLAGKTLAKWKSLEASTTGGGSTSVVSGAGDAVTAKNRLNQIVLELGLGVAIQAPCFVQQALKKLRELNKV